MRSTLAAQLLEMMNFADAQVAQAVRPPLVL